MYLGKERGSISERRSVMRVGQSTQWMRTAPDESNDGLYQDACMQCLLPSEMNTALGADGVPIYTQLAHTLPPISRKISDL